MTIKEKVDQFTFEYHHRLKMTWQQLRQCGIDCGFTTVTKYGRDFHQLTKDICISFMKFHEGHLTNLLFSNGRPIHLDFDEQEIISYYSDYIELRYILEGEVETEIEGELAYFKEGEFCFIDSMAYHRESIRNSNGLLLNVSVKRDVFTDTLLNSVSGTPLQKFLRQNILQQSNQQHYLKFIPVLPEQKETSQEYLFQIVEEMINQRSGYLEISKGFIIRLMDYLSGVNNHISSREENDLYTQKLFESVSQFMRDNLQDMNMADLTRNFHFQPNYFNNLIKKQTGMTYSDYLIHLRMEQAKRLLISSNINIEEIMWMVGYHNKGFFCKKFREQTGLNPSRFRSLNQKNGEFEKSTDIPS